MENEVKTDNVEIKTEPEKTEVKPLSNTEIADLINAKLEAEKAKWKEDFKKEFKEEKAEADKLAKMSESDKEKAKFDKEKEAFDKEKKEFAIKQLISETATQLAEDGLPAVFAKLLVRNNAEDTKANMDSFKNEWQKALEAEVNKKLAGGVVPKASTTTAVTMTKEQFNSLSYTDRVELYNTNPDLYKQLNQ